MSDKTKNKHGRVGVARTRPTRKQLKENMLAHGRREGREEMADMILKERERFEKERDFTLGLLKLRNAAQIHEAIRSRLG